MIIPILLYFAVGAAVARSIKSWDNTSASGSPQLGAIIIVFWPLVLVMLLLGLID